MPQKTSFNYLSEILNSGVAERNGVMVEKLHDIAMRISEEVYPRPEAYIVERGFIKKEYAHIKVDDVQEIDKTFKLRIPIEDIQFKKTRLNGMVPLPGLPC